MTLSRALSLPTHAALELLVGLALMVAPVALGAGTAASVAAVPLGAIVVGLSFAGSNTGERGSLSVSSHAVYDWAMGIALIGGGAILAISGDAIALGVYLLAGLAMLALHATTRYTPIRH